MPQLFQGYFRAQKTIGGISSMGVTNYSEARGNPAKCLQGSLAESYAPQQDGKQELCPPKGAGT